MTAATCPRAGKWIGGCRFEARYELGASEIHKLGRLTSSEVLMENLAKQMRHRTYIHDICVRCGRTVEPSVVNLEAPHPATDADLGEGGEGV